MEISLAGKVLEVRSPEVFALVILKQYPFSYYEYNSLVNIRILNTDEIIADASLNGQFVKCWLTGCDLQRNLIARVRIISPHALD